MTAKESWLSLPPGSGFSLDNIPFGIFSTPRTPLRAATRLGDYVVDLAAVQRHGLLRGLSLPEDIFAHPYLNPFISLNKSVSRAVRQRLIALFSAGEEVIAKDPALQKQLLHKVGACQLSMPIAVGDYTDFYSSLEHASNVGSIFRDPKNPLLPNWRHLPVGYHGRASSIVPSGTPIQRPWGQIKPTTSEKPLYAPSQQMDFELELAFVTRQENPLGTPIPIAEAADYIFGFLLFNDWSARDIQAWEYVPLGPFLGKNFASSLAPWLVTLEALEPFKTPPPMQNPTVLPYLQCKACSNFDIDLTVSLTTARGTEQLITQTNAKYLYWTPQQQLAHHTVNGCNVRVGDLYASGTISGPTQDSYGSMLELTWRGERPLQLPDGTTRSFLHDGDCVSMGGQAKKDARCVDFGTVEGTITPAQPKN